MIGSRIRFLLKKSTDQRGKVLQKAKFKFLVCLTNINEVCESFFLEIERVHRKISFI